MELEDAEHIYARKRMSTFGVLAALFFSTSFWFSNWLVLGSPEDFFGTELQSTVLLGILIFALTLSISQLLCVDAARVSSTYPLVPGRAFLLYVIAITLIIVVVHLDFRLQEDQPEYAAVLRTSAVPIMFLALTYFDRWCVKVFQSAGAAFETISARYDRHHKVSRWLLLLSVVFFIVQAYAAWAYANTSLDQEAYSFTSFWLFIGDILLAIGECLLILGLIIGPTFWEKSQ